MSRNGDLGLIQLSCKRAAGIAIQAGQFIHHEFQVLWPRRPSKSQALLITAPGALSEMAAKNRLHKPSIGELDRRRFVGVIHRGNHITTAVEILEQECVVGERTRIPMREEDYGM